MDDLKSVVHLTTVHPSFDIRIFHKECKTLSQAGYRVVLIAPHDRDEETDGIRIRRLANPKSRLDRMTRMLWQTYKRAIEEDAQVYHFHDPELIPVGLMLKLHGKRVIYDVHEDYSQTFLSREWIFPRLRRLIRIMIILAELVGRRLFDGIVVATPSIAVRFQSLKTVTIQNFPLLDGSGINPSIPYDRREKVVVYVGVISEPRGVKEMIQAVALLPTQLGVKLKLAGFFAPSNLEDKVKTFSGWSRVDFMGWQFHKDIVAMLGNARIGLAVLHPFANHINSQPNKLFEYMSAGIPVVASDFPLWRQIVEETGCGLLVNPLDARAISKAIKWLLEHPEEAGAMGRRGQEAVRNRYNWDREADNLLAFYQKITKWDPKPSVA
ncbi:MAG: glycosyltransferase family 4 protein [Thermodesulfobacteriota bacterium]